MRVTPDARGLIPEVDAQRLKEFGEEINRRFGKPVAATKGEGNKLNLKLQKPVQINAVVLCEDIAQGERVRLFTVEGKVNGKWTVLTSGSCIGYKYIKVFNPDVVSALRLKVELYCMIALYHCFFED